MRTALQPPPGIFGDETAFSAAGQWWTCNNVRFWRERPQVIGGWQRLADSPLAGVCRNVFAWTDADAVLHIAFGTHSHLHVWKDAALYDATPPGLLPGLVDTVAGSGFGVGTYGSGDYSEPQFDASKLRTWDLGAWGEYLLAHPRGGPIYEWTLSPSSPAAALSNAPIQVSSMLVAAQDQVFALGCEEEVSGSFNPLCIRHSGVRANTVWHTAPHTTAREYILPGGGRIVAGRTVGPNLLIWTTHALFLGTFVGSPGQVWRFDRVGEKCGLVAPNAVVVVGQSAYWLGPDLQFRRYSLGGYAELIPCPIREDMADNMVSAQVEKIVGSSNSKFGEVRFDYPDVRDGSENSRYVAVSLLDGAWYRGRMARTAMIDAGPQESPIGVAPIVAPGDLILVESDGGAAAVEGPSIDLAPFASGYVQRVRAGLATMDFTAQTYGLLPYDYARAGVATALTAAGELKHFAQDLLRATDRGALIESEATNLEIRSTQLGDASWTKGRLTVIADAASAPDGTLTADKLQETAVSGDHSFHQATAVAAGETYTLSRHLKAGERTMVEIAARADGGVYADKVARFDLVTGQVLFSDCEAAGIEALADGWFRCWATATAQVSGSGVFVTRVYNGASSYLGEVGKGLYAWGCQFERGERPSSYIPTASTVATRGADALSIDAAGGYTYWHERGESADGAPIAWEIEAADQYLSEDVTAMLLGVWPDLADQVGPVNLTVSTRQKPQGEARIYMPVAIAPGQGKADMRARGRLFRMKLSGSSAPTAARIGRIVVQFEPAGGR